MHKKGKYSYLKKSYITEECLRNPLLNICWQGWRQKSSFQSLLEQMICLHTLWTKSPNSVMCGIKSVAKQKQIECPQIGDKQWYKVRIGVQKFGKFRKIPTLILINVKTKKQRKTLKRKNLDAHKRQNSSIWNLSPVKHATFLRKRRKHQFTVKVQKAEEAVIIKISTLIFLNWQFKNFPTAYLIAIL